MKFFLYTLLLFSLSTPFAVQAQETTEDRLPAWLMALEAEALQAGISKSIFDTAMAGFEAPAPKVLKLDRNQPEKRLNFAQYRHHVLTRARIAQGQRLYRQHRDLLERVAKKYDVPAKYIVALWGIETSYGNNTGDFNVVHALATLAYDGRRSAFFRKELIGALKILEEGHIAPENMKGSWAGAMGQNQFMPSSFHAYAVDENGDGKHDIWGDLEDVFASTATYLKKNGWKGDERWGRRVLLPEGFDEALINPKRMKSLSKWKSLGLTRADGGPLPVVADMKASVVAPDGPDGPVFLVYDNYHVLLRWNRSLYFATSVGLLADQIGR